MSTVLALQELDAVDELAPIIEPQSMPQRVVKTQGTYRVHTESFSLITRADTPAFHDLTPLAQAVVQRSEIHAGAIVVSTKHTTCAVIIQEREPLLIQDMADRLRRFAGADEEYRHNDFEHRTVNMCDGECANGHAHCQHLVLGASITLPVTEGTLLLGLWQRIFLVELDRSRLRHYTVQVMGCSS